MLKNKLITELKNYFGNDKKRIDHALKVTEYAEQLIDQFKEKYPAKNINEQVIIYSAVLHDIGIKNAELKYNSSSGHYQEIEGPPVAREIMESHNIDFEMMDEIAEIIAHHHTPGKIGSNNFKLLYDADWLVNLPDVYGLKNKDKNEIKKLIDKVFLSDIGKELARKEFL
ncbi:HD domain-containing protein [Halanaerobium saccharolyticum]|uniref:HD domain-containing protein n=1 Tax=Halanaerobium saccharolyticum TaxID=43595 RepID=UPI003FCD6F3F